MDRRSLLGKLGMAGLGAGVLAAPALGRSSGLGLPGARVHASAAYTLASGADMRFDAVDWDDAGFYNSSRPARLTIPTGHGGRYQFGAFVDVGAGYTGKLGLLINGSSFTDAIVGRTQAAGSLDPLDLVVGAHYLPAGCALSVRWFVDGSALVSKNAHFWLQQIG
jgi:hypothetical protein